MMSVTPEALALGAKAAPPRAGAHRPTPGRPPWPVRRLPDLATLVIYSALAWYVSGPLWIHPGRRVGAWGSDQLLLRWQLAHAAHAVTRLSNPFVTTALNAPDGVNLAANANILGLGIPLTPVTLVAGPAVALCVATTGSLIATAMAWYWVLARPLHLNRAAAAVGGACGAFGPVLLNESSAGHQHLSAQFLVPLIVWRFARLAAPGARPWRDGAILGALAGYQGLIGEEVLLFTAIGVAAFGLGYAIGEPGIMRRAVRTLTKGLAVAGAVAVALLAVPLAYQFAGAQHFSGAPIDPQLFPATVMTYVGVPARALSWLHLDGWAGAVADPGPYLGAPVLLVILGFGWPLRRNPVFVGTLTALVALAVASWGTRVHVRGAATAVPGPWRLVAHLPAFEWVVPYRLGMMTAPAAGVALALILDHWMRRWPAGARLTPAVAWLATICALAPLAPVRPATVPLPAVPRFVTTGDWRPYLPAGRSLVTVPVTSVSSLDGMRWSAAARTDFALAGGYFLGPTPDGKGALFGPPYRWTTAMLIQVAATGQVHRAAPGDRDRLLADLRYWRAGVLVLVPSEQHDDALLATVSQFLGPPQRVDDVLLWDVRRSI